jgi:hypothetical protein
MVYWFLRFAAVPLAFLSWILYQLFVKKKRFRDLQNDLLTIAAFLVIWFILIWFVLS